MSQDGVSLPGRLDTPGHLDRPPTARAGALPRLGARTAPAAKWAIRRTTQASQRRWVRSAAMDARHIRRLGLVIHPRREVAGVVDALASWSDAHEVELVQLRAPGQDRHFVPAGDPA